MAEYAECIPLLDNLHQRCAPDIVLARAGRVLTSCKEVQMTAELFAVVAYTEVWGLCECEVDCHRNKPRRN